MASISSLGIGSGLDIGNLVKSLVDAEGAGKKARLDRREVDYTAKLSIIGSVKSALKDFQSSYTSLKLSSSFKSFTATSSDSSAFTATAVNGAVEASYALTIDKIALAHKQKSVVQADKTTSIGTGTLEFVQGVGPGATTTNVDITEGSLEGIRDAINNANFGVDASIVYNGTGYVLSIASETGTDNAFTSISTVASGVPVTGDLSDFTTANLTDIQAADDAVFSVNGVNITSQTNTITSTIDNVEFELKSGDGGVATQTLTIGRDTSSVSTAVQEFVDGYNSLISGLNSATFYNEDTEQGGILIGDPTVRGIVSQLRGMLNTTTGDSLTEFNSFSSIGILTARDGTLEFDATKLSAALISKPEEIQNLLAGGSASISELGIDVISVTDNIGGGSYPVEITPTQALFETTASGALPFDLSVLPYSAANALDFSVKIDGFSSGTLSIPAINYAGATDLDKGQAIAAAIQASINADATLISNAVSSIVTFEETAPASGLYTYKISSTSYGPDSSVEFNPIGGSIDAVLNSGGGNAGAPVTGGRTGTIGGEPAAFDGNRMTGSGLYAGFVLDINDTAVSGVHNINVSAGNISKLDTLINSFLDADGTLSAKTTGLSASIATITEQRAALASRLESLESRLIKQFSAMDSLVAQLNSTSSFLTNQLEQISNIGKK